MASKFGAYDDTEEPLYGIDFGAKGQGTTS